MTASAAPPPDGTGVPRIAISPKASRAIDTWAWGLVDGSIRLWQLPDAICTLYQIAFQDGRASRDDEVRKLTADADRLWLRAFGDDARKQYLLARLDDAADLANRPNVDDVLDEAWRLYVASLDSIREPVRLESTEHTKKEAA